MFIFYSFCDTFCQYPVPDWTEEEPPEMGGGRPGSATDTHSCGQVRGVPSNLRSRTHMYPHGLGNFYQKYTEAYGIPVIGWCIN